MTEQIEQDEELTGEWVVQEWLTITDDDVQRYNSLCVSHPHLAVGMDAWRGEAVALRDSVNKILDELLAALETQKIQHEKISQLKKELEIINTAMDSLINLCEGASGELSNRGSDLLQPEFASPGKLQKNISTVSSWATRGAIRIREQLKNILKMYDDARSS